MKAQFHQIDNILTDTIFFMISSTAFVKGETQLIRLVEDLARNLISGAQTNLILLDFSKAFDKVSHLKLLYKLIMHGLCGNTLQWIQSFLIGRTQTVILEGQNSDELTVTSGVPQGSVLRPILFLLYIHV